MAADDTVVYFTAPTWNQLKLKTEKNFAEIIEFFERRKLTVNMDKTKFMTFTSLRTGKPSFDTLCIKTKGYSFQVKSTEYIKYLGIMMDCHLRWNEQANLVIKKIRSLLGKFKSLREICEQDELARVYQALVEPHLNYAILSWGGIANSYYKGIEVAQKWVLKIIYRKPITYPTESLYELSNMFTVRQLYARALLMHQHQLQVPTKNRKDMRSPNIPLPMPKKTIGLKSHTYLAPLLYNTLPKNIKDTRAKSAFNNKIKKWIRSKPSSFWYTFTNRNNFI